MKKLLLLIIVLGFGWWFFIGGRTINEDQVRNFYQQQQAATLSRAPLELCDLLDSEFQFIGTTSSVGGQRSNKFNKKESCDAYQSMYADLEKIGNSLGGMAQLDHRYEIANITISADKKSALVEVSYSLDVAGSVINITAKSTETIVRRNGKALLQKSDAKMRISGKSP